MGSACSTAGRQNPVAPELALLSSLARGELIVPDGRPAATQQGGEIVMRRNRWGDAAVGAASLVVVGLIALTGCASNPPAATPSETAPVTGSVQQECPNYEGGVCLGPIQAGTYTTVQFSPTLTYTVPDGWSNFEDTEGNFLLVPEPYDLAGVNAETSDFIGVYTSVQPGNCNYGPTENVPLTADGLLEWTKANPAFAATGDQPVTVGGLTGYVVALRVAPDWTTPCGYSGGKPVAPLMSGLSPSGLQHQLHPGQATRMYFLDSGSGVLAIEVVDIEDLGHLDAYSEVVDSFQFG